MNRALLCLAAALVALAAGCGGGEPATGDGTTAPGTTTATARTRLAVYLVDGEAVRPVRRTVEATDAVGRAALEALLDGPSAAERADGYATAIPAGTELLDLDVEEGLATVDLSGAFASGGGSASMLLRVAQVVYTLTRFASVERVAFRLDGEPAAAIGGEGVVVDPPIGRKQLEAQAPPILVEEPLPGDTVGVRVRVAGTATATEATLGAQLLAGDAVVDDVRPVTTSAGAPERGDFELTFDAGEHTGPATVSVYEPSLEDGSPLHTVRVPVDVRP